MAADAAQISAKIRQRMHKLQGLQQYTSSSSEQSVEISSAAATAAEFMTDNKNHFEVGLIMGGMDMQDEGKPRLFQFSEEFPCGIAVHSCAMGSGMLAANSVLDSYQARSRVDYAGKKRVVLPSKGEAVRVVSKAVLAGIHNDLGSGSNVDICIIDTGGATLMEPYIASPIPKTKNADSQATGEIMSNDEGSHDDLSVRMHASPDIGDLVCRRRQTVKKLVFSKSPVRLHSSTDETVGKDLPFASIV